MPHVLILAVVQGLTEFLPISSSGHLALLQQLFGLKEGALFLDVVLHVGTLGSVLCVYRREAARLLRLDRLALAYVGALAVGTLPAVAVGLLLKESIASLFASTLPVALALLVTGVLLLSTRAARPACAEETDAWQPCAPAPWRALVIGGAQALAILPGLSRSGATITASLWMGLPRAEAARFSFLLSVPAILGALVLHLVEGVPTEGASVAELLAGALVAFGVGLLAIRWTTRAVIARHFWRFAFYCFALGLAALSVATLG